MKEKPDVLQGTLALMVLKTLDVLGPQHGYGIARRIEQISGDLLALNQGTLYPLLLKLEHEGSISSQWGASENNRRTRFYRLRTCLKTEFKGGRLRFVASHPFAKKTRMDGARCDCAGFEVGKSEFLGRLLENGAAADLFPEDGVLHPCEF